jgi:SAM-dependent methyltransferase
MAASTPSQTSVLRAASQWWNDSAARVGKVAAARLFAAAIWEFIRDSTPERRRQRYGDADYDWDHRVNTTSAAVGWRDRLLGVFHSPYQPTEPALFREMMEALQRQMQTARTQTDATQASLGQIGLQDFVFIDLGSGKGRTLLMASDYPFRRIVGVELLPALHSIAQENLSKYHGEAQKCFALEAICGDACEFDFPAEPTVLYLFNPFPEAGLRHVLANLEESLRAHARALYVLYHNPLLEPVLAQSTSLRKIEETQQYSVFREKSC